MSGPVRCCPATVRKSKSAAAKLVAFKARDMLLGHIKRYGKQMRILKEFNTTDNENNTDAHGLFPLALDDKDYDQVSTFKRDI